MTISNGSKTIKISRWEVYTIVGGITVTVGSICNVINKNIKRIRKKNK